MIGILGDEEEVTEKKKRSALSDVEMISLCLDLYSILLIVIYIVFSLKESRTFPEQNHSVNRVTYRKRIKSFFTHLIHKTMGFIQKFSLSYYYIKRRKMDERAANFDNNTPLITRSSENRVTKTTDADTLSSSQNSRTVSFAFEKASDSASIGSGSRTSLTHTPILKKNSGIRSSNLVNNSPTLGGGEGAGLPLYQSPTRSPNTIDSLIVKNALFSPSFLPSITVGAEKSSSSSAASSPSSLIVSNNTRAPFPPTAAPLASETKPHVSVRHAECPICFEDLCKEVTSVFVTPKGKRVCPHYFHERCIRNYTARSCPLCRAPFSFRRRVPNPEVAPSLWFKIVDIDGSGTLSKEEVIQILRAQVPVDRNKLIDMLNLNWRTWDVDGNGTIDVSELIHPENGLLAFVKAHREELMKTLRGAPPDIRLDPKGWFDYWDEDRSETLDQDEVVRALIKTFDLSSSEDVAITLQRIVSNIWPIFDIDGDGAIDREEFLEPKLGLGYALVASLRAKTTTTT